MSTVKVYPITFGPYHHLFGFHDLYAWNATHSRIVVLRVKDISTPPDPNLIYPIGYVDEMLDFVEFGSTRAFNYPQGARQQWFADTNLVVVNDLDKSKFVTRLYDTDSHSLLDTFEHPAHVIADDGWAYGLDYARLFRLGAYGYAGVEDSTKDDDAPYNSGIVAHNIETRESYLLLSVNKLVDKEKQSVCGHHHYITHLLLSPDQQRIAFLHRSKLDDGGEMTRLCTLGRDGNGLRVLASGFMSHFDWLDNCHIMIYGRRGTVIEKARRSLLYRLTPTPILKYLKKVVRGVYYKGQHVNRGTFRWEVFSDETPSVSFTLPEKVITEDGHPMFCPVNRDWFVCDTYPNAVGIRELFLFNWRVNQKIVLGSFRMICDKPDLEKSIRLLAGTDPSVMETIGAENLAFTRSGLHCDLHPRWCRDGKRIAFDSIHDGTRQVYCCNVDHLIPSCNQGDIKDQYS